MWGDPEGPGLGRDARQGSRQRHRPSWSVPGAPRAAGFPSPPSRAPAPLQEGVGRAGRLRSTRCGSRSSQGPRQGARKPPWPAPLAGRHRSRCRLLGFPRRWEPLLRRPPPGRPRGAPPGGAFPPPRAAACTHPAASPPGSGQRLCSSAPLPRTKPALWAASRPPAWLPPGAPPSGAHSRAGLGRDCARAP